MLKKRYKMEPAPRANPDQSLYGPWILRDMYQGGIIVARGETRDHLEDVYDRKGIKYSEIR